jgi:hypothetical protein
VVWQLYKIHNDFENMLPMEQKPVFPPKKLVNSNPMFIENRRQVRIHQRFALAVLQQWLVHVLVALSRVSTRVNATTLARGTNERDILVTALSA